VLTFTIVSILGAIFAGAVLGLHYKVFILVPVATFALVFVIVVGVTRGAGIWEVAQDMFLVAMVLQFAYFTSAFAAKLRRLATALPGPDSHRLIAPAWPGAFLHSITSSARASSVAGTSRPSALAVFRLMTSSYLVGA
jgi:hypothetical protein